jgi:hypothetical protein
MTPNEHDDDLGLSPNPERYPTDEYEYVPDYEEPRPTAMQLAYLRALVQRTGQTFAYPRTAAQASREIRRLKAAKPSSRIERAVERKRIADAIAAGPDDAARVRDTEIQGFGSSYRDLEEAIMTTPTVTELRRNGNRVGDRVELARYAVPGARERVLYGQRVDGVVRVVDRPRDGGRCYLVEREL